MSALVLVRLGQELGTLDWLELAALHVAQSYWSAGLVVGLALVGALALRRVVVPRRGLQRAVA